MQDEARIEEGAATAAKARTALMRTAGELAAMRGHADPALAAMLETAAEVIGALAKALDHHGRTDRTARY